MLQNVQHDPYMVAMISDDINKSKQSENTETNVDAAAIFCRKYTLARS